MHGTWQGILAAVTGTVCCVDRNAGTEQLMVYLQFVRYTIRLSFPDTPCVDATLTMHDRPSNAADQAADKAQIKPRTMAAGAAAPISLKARQKVSGGGSLHVRGIRQAG
jgi:hypothetical protein